MPETKKKHESYDFDFEVQTIRACPAHLCGYDFDFKNEIIEEDGNKMKVGMTYLLKAKDYPAKEEPEKSALPEIIKKLTHPRNQIVRIMQRIKV